jgi:hypothetical protein
MKFTIEEINEKQLMLLGIDKAMLHGLPKRTQDALLNGGRTALMRFPKLNIPGMEGQCLDAKLSLEKKQDGSVGLKFHPNNKTPRNAFQLSGEEINTLKEDKKNFIEKEIGGKLHLVCIDKDTNEFIAVNKKSITAPEAINGFYLTPKQKQDFANGEDININGKTVRLQPADELQVENKNNPGEALERIQFKHSSYTQYDLLLDLALCSVGMGHIIMLGHLLNLMLHTQSDYYKNLRQSDKRRLQNAVVKTHPEYEAKLKKGAFITPKELKQMIENHLDRHIETGVIPEESLVFKAGNPTGIDVVIKDDASTAEHRTEHHEQQQEQQVQHREQAQHEYPGGYDYACNREISFEEEDDFLPAERVKIKI